MSDNVFGLAKGPNWNGVPLIGAKEDEKAVEEKADEVDALGWTHGDGFKVKNQNVSTGEIRLTDGGKTATYIPRGVRFHAPGALQTSEIDVGDLTGVVPFASHEERAKAYADPRYKKSGDYRREVARRDSVTR